MLHHIGDVDPGGAVLIFNKWAEQPNRRVWVWRLTNGDIRIEFVNIDGDLIAAANLTSYRADDLAQALTRTKWPLDTPC